MQGINHLAPHGGIAFSVNFLHHPTISRATKVPWGYHDAATAIRTVGAMVNAS